MCCCLKQLFCLIITLLRWPLMLTENKHLSRDSQLSNLLHAVRYSRYLNTFLFYWTLDTLKTFFSNFQIPEFYHRKEELFVEQLTQFCHHRKSLFFLLTRNCRIHCMVRFVLISCFNYIIEKCMFDILRKHFFVIKLGPLRRKTTTKVNQTLYLEHKGI